MRFVVFLLLVLVVAAIALAVWHIYYGPKDVPQSVTYVTVEADKRKSIGAKIAGYGVDFKW